MAAAQERRQFIRNMRLSLLDLSRRLEHGATEDDVDYVIFRLRQITRHLLRLGGVEGLPEEVQNNLLTVTMLLNQVEDEHIRPAVQPTRHHGCRGRPRFEIPREQLEYLVSYDFSFVDIAKALGVSVSTINRRAREYGISVRERQTVITNEELDTVVLGIKAEFPNAGYRRVHSQLMVRNIKVPQLSVREAMHRCDPEGVAMRWLSITPRAQYSVHGPLSLWHIDGNHKLIR
jgi:hypothetical protein